MTKIDEPALELIAAEAERRYHSGEVDCPVLEAARLVREGWVPKPVSSMDAAVFEWLAENDGKKDAYLNGGEDALCWIFTNPDKLPQPDSFQSRVQPWMMACFGETISADREERNHRFLEEALELVQSCGCSASEAHQLVDYVYGRPVGDPKQEVGGVMVTLAALCLANGLDMHDAGETELARIWTKVDQIRAKQAAKPKHSPLPMAVDPQPERGAVSEAAIKQMVNRFLAWKLPEDFHPDGGISFEAVSNQGSKYEFRHEPVGTNLFSAMQAEAMVRHMLEGVEPLPNPEHDGVERKAITEAKKLAALSSREYFMSHPAPDTDRYADLIEWAGAVGRFAAHAYWSAFESGMLEMVEYFEREGWVNPNARSHFGLGEG